MAKNRTFGSIVMLAALCVHAAAFATTQSFVGKWQTRKSQVTGKSTITVIIVEEAGKVGGTVILVNPDRSEIELPIVNPKLTKNTISFETKDGATLYRWRLTVKKNARTGFLVGSSGEMLIEAKVVKQR